MMETIQTFVKKPVFRRRLITFRNLLIIVITALLILTWLVKNYDYFNFDLTVTLFVQDFHQVWFDLLMKLVSKTGTLTVGSAIIFVVALILAFLGKFKSALMVTVSSYGVMGLGQVLKQLIERPRPSARLIHQIGLYPKSDSFPSGHVLFAVGLYGFLLFLVFTQLKDELLLKKVLIAALSLPLIFMGLSRIYLGAHWFSDVLGAYLIGYIWLFIMIHLYHTLGAPGNLKPKKF